MSQPILIRLPLLRFSMWGQRQSLSIRSRIQPKWTMKKWRRQLPREQRQYWRWILAGFFAIMTGFFKRYKIKEIFLLQVVNRLGQVPRPPPQFQEYEDLTLPLLLQNLSKPHGYCIFQYSLNYNHFPHGLFQ